jgi:arylsulfatase A-like enzyme
MGRGEDTERPFAAAAYTRAVPPNVLLVVLDAARRDALEPYGAAAGSTPVIGQLASRGQALPAVYATACWTVPSHASMLTGLMPRAAGLSRVGSPMAAGPVVESHRDRLLPELLRRSGYATAGLSANLWLSEASGFDTGFDEFVEVDTGRYADLHRKGARGRLRWLAQAGRAKVDDGARESARILDRLASESAGRPFFWFVNLIECHSPYLPPRGYGDVSLLDRLRAAEDARRYYGLDAIWRACLGGAGPPEAALERLRRLYQASITYMDDWLGRVLERLDRVGKLDDTVVIVTADHGENLGEAGLLTHALSLDNRLIHVPFVVTGPGTRSATINSLAELPRLVAEVAGVDEHPWHDGPPPGFGVAQFDPPADPGEPRASETVARWGLGDEALARLTTPLTCAVAGNLKLMRRGDREELYDLAADPLEVAPKPVDELATEHGEPLAQLRAALDHPAVAGSAVAGTSAATQTSEEELRDIEERMKLLGYM